MFEGELNPSLDRLQCGLGEGGELAYCYIIETVKCEGERFVQKGCGPNFEGGRVTLCTCKHRMRSSLDPAGWRGRWVAGFTGKGAVGDGYRYLVYLMRVGEAYASQRELWDGLSPTERAAKDARTNRLGDAFPAKSPLGEPHDPACYHPPCRDHSHAPDGWKNDIEYVGFSQRNPALLVGDPDRSYVWDRPRMRYEGTLGRGYKRMSAGELLASLCDVDAG
jgi:hypothetical protein